MRRDRATRGRHVAPSDHGAALDGDDLRIASLDIARDEGADLFDRGSLHERDIFALAGNDVDRGAEGIRVGDLNLAEFDAHGRARWFGPEHSLNVAS